MLQLGSRSNSCVVLLESRRWREDGRCGAGFVDRGDLGLMLFTEEITCQSEGGAIAHLISIVSQYHSRLLEPTVLDRPHVAKGLVGLACRRFPREFERQCLVNDDIHYHVLSNRDTRGVNLGIMYSKYLHVHVHRASNPAAVSVSVRWVHVKCGRF